MRESRASSDGVPRLWAFSVVSLGWAAVVAIATTVFVLALAPRLPAVVTIFFPGRNNRIHEYPLEALTIGLVVGVAIFAVFGLVMLGLSATVQPSIGLGFGIALVVLSVLVVGFSFALITSSLFQLDQSQSLGSSGGSIGPVTVAVALGYVVDLCLVLASFLFVVRRLTVGVWRAPERRSRRP